MRYRRAELADRFGTPPPPVRNLLETVRLKLLAAEAGYRLLSVKNGRVILRNPTGSIYRLPDGHAPRLDYRDPPELRMMHLAKYLRGAKL